MHSQSGQGAARSPADSEYRFLFGSTVWRPRILTRYGVRAFSLRTWSSKSKQQELAVLRRVKRDLPPAAVAEMAGEVSDFIESAYGRYDGAITSIACGHSRRPDCLSCQLGRAVAEQLGVRVVEAFAFRPLEGHSHPLGFMETPPLQVVHAPSRVIVIDDVWTSGFHMHEALSALRAAGSEASGIVWLAA